MPEFRPSRRELLRGIGLAAAAGAGITALGACSADPYRRGPIAGRPAGDGATVGAAPSGQTSGTRQVVFQGVTYSVPERASRVVTIGDACLEPALDLMAPVVATSPISPAAIPPARKAALRDLPVVGSGRESDALTADDVWVHDPDLVLAAEGTDRQLVTTLGSRVPVIVARTSGEFGHDWRGRIRGLADVLGVDTHPGLEEAYTTRTMHLRRERAEVLTVAPVVVLRAWDRQRITAYGPASVIGRMYAEAGARFVPAVQARVTSGMPGEFEDVLPNVDRYLSGARVIMLASDYAGGLDAFTGGSLANSDVVKEYVATHDAVMRGAGVLKVTSYAQAHDMLDRLDAALGDVARA